MSLPHGDLNDVQERQRPSLRSGEPWPRQGKAPFAVCRLLKKINLCSWSQIRHHHIWQNKVTIIIFKGKNKWLKTTSRFTSQILNFGFHPFCIFFFFFFKASDLASPPPQELYLLLLWNLAEITLFSGLTWSCYKKILTRFVSFPVAHLISLVWGFPSPDLRFCAGCLSNIIPHCWIHHSFLAVLSDSFLSTAFLFYLSCPFLFVMSRLQILKFIHIYH